jgi:hypothetical protein
LRAATSTPTTARAPAQLPLRPRPSRGREHWDWKKALDPNNRLSQIASFGEDEAGEIYVLSLSGTVWKLVPKGS